MHNFIFRTWMIHLESIEHDYIMSVLQAHTSLVHLGKHQYQDEHLYFSALMTYLNSVHGLQFPPDQHWFCSIATAVLLAASMSSTFFILSMTFDRVYSIIRPHKAASFNTVKRAKITIWFILMFSCSFNIPYLFIITNNGPECVTDLVQFEKKFFFWLSYVVQFVIPFLSLLSMNSVIIHTLRTRSLFKISNNEAQAQGQNKSQSQNKSQMSKSKSTETQIYLILLLVAFSFFILITPLYAFNLYVQFVDFTKSPKAFAEFYIFFQIMHKMYFTNNAINFFLYVISGQKFRTDLINLFKRREQKFNEVSQVGKLSKGTS